MNQVYLDKYLELIPSLRKRSRKLYFGTCPFHKEKTNSFALYTEKMRFFCYGCKKKGDIFDVIQEIQGLTFTQAKNSLGIENDDSYKKLPIHIKSMEDIRFYVGKNTYSREIIIENENLKAEWDRQKDWAFFYTIESYYSLQERILEGILCQEKRLFTCSLEKTLRLLRKTKKQRYYSKESW